MIWIALLIVVGRTPAIAQSLDAPRTLQQPAEHPSFDVASIHPDNADHTARTHIYSYAMQGHFVGINVPLLQLIQYAYALPDSRILGAPDWAQTSKYDIEAKSDPLLVDQLAGLPPATAKAKLLEMVQTLLKDRFQLAVHTEKRDLPVYDLVVEKGGPKFAAVKNDGTTVDSGTHNGAATINIRSSTHATSDLAEILARYVGRVVMDRTGLQGTFTLDLHFTVDDSTASPRTAANSPAGDLGPSVFTALKEQLGLKLKSARAPIDVLVVDHIEQPTKN